METAEKPKLIQLDLLRNNEATKQVDEKKDFDNFVKKSLKGLFARYNEIEFFFLGHDDEIEATKQSLEHLTEEVRLLKEKVGR